MSSSQDTSTSLVQAVDTSLSSLSSSLTTLSSLTSSHSLLTSSSSSTSLPPFPPGLCDIFRQLLQSLQQTITSLALSFKSPITPDAAIQQIHKLSDQTAQLVSCILASGTMGLSILVDDWIDGMVNVIQEEHHLIQGLRLTAIRVDVQGKDEKGSQEMYLNTGKVWDAIDGLLKLPLTEVEAVVRRWKIHGELVKDAWTEFCESLEVEEDGEQEEEFEEDEEWAELDALGGKKYSQEDRETALAIKPILSLHHILHSSIPQRLPLLSSDPEQTYRSILQASGKFLDAFDTVIAALYPDQSPREIDDAVRNLEKSSKAILTILRERLAIQVVDESMTEKREVFGGSLDKWEKRFNHETERWNGRSLNLSALAAAL
ncbi:hypothetical protein M231_06367 [Tremella mesenterica]|uniref:Cyclin-D1-binding protein 1-like N-terminal domain-containing protein n=1 Tax=Tremella mesenterica TaxID=5217 RepID=A0A4Q1BGB0_TREME|nr:hypothetical protein M231_06367 [Tremella mesenterica]